MKRYVVDSRHIGSFQDFVTVMNEVVIRPAGGEWNGNLDAFNDYLSWPAELEYELEIAGADHCAVALGSWREGEALFDVIKELIAANDHVHLVLS